MKTSTNLKLLLPEGKDPVNIDDITGNFETLDTKLADMQSATSDASKNTVVFSQAADRQNIASTETLSTIMGKIAKFFSDIKAAAFCTVENNDTTTTTGCVADARIVKTHGDEIDELSKKLSSFQAGVDALYNQCVSLGVTPAGKTLSNIKDALNSVYNTGVTAADNRVNTGSTNYKNGYNTGYSTGVTAADARVSTSSASYTSGYAAGKAAATVKVKYASSYSVNQLGTVHQLQFGPTLTKQSDGTWLLDCGSLVMVHDGEDGWVSREMTRSYTTTTLS